MTEVLTAASESPRGSLRLRLSTRKCKSVHGLNSIALNHDGLGTAYQAVIKM